jgi:hypothetical protein
MKVIFSLALIMFTRLCAATSYVVCARMLKLLVATNTLWVLSLVLPSLWLSRKIMSPLETALVVTTTSPSSLDGLDLLLVTVQLTMAMLVAQSTLTMLVVGSFIPHSVP